MTYGYPVRFSDHMGIKAPIKAKKLLSISFSVGENLTGIGASCFSLIWNLNN
jgi:hypothetical protein